MIVKNYAAVSGVLSFVAAIFLQTWGWDEFPGTGFIAFGAIVAVAGCASCVRVERFRSQGPTRIFNRFLALIAIGSIMASVGVCILPADGWERLARIGTSLGLAAFAGAVLFRNPFESGQHGPSVSVRTAFGIMCPVFALAILPWVWSYAPDTVQNRMTVATVIIGFASLVGHWVSPDFSDRGAVLPSRQTA